MSPQKLDKSPEDDANQDLTAPLNDTSAEEDAGAIAALLGGKPGAGGKDRIKGVFSTQKLMRVGTGTTQRKTIQKTYWFCRETDGELIEIQPLNRNYVPAGPKKIVPKDELVEKFSPEPEFYTYNVFPKIKELLRSIAKGEKHRERGEPYSAEYEFNNALKVDEENIRANFGLGLTYLTRGETNKAEDIFQRVVKLDAAFEPEHKHLFNEFGINLRKSKMIDQALEYYTKALNFTQVDENLYYNIARAWFEKRDFKKSLDNLVQALRINPNHPEVRQFLSYLNKKGLIEGDMPTEARLALDRMSD